MTFSLFRPALGPWIEVKAHRRLGVDGDVAEVCGLVTPASYCGFRNRPKLCRACHGPHVRHAATRVDCEPHLDVAADPRGAQHGRVLRRAARPAAVRASLGNPGRDWEGRCGHHRLRTGRRQPLARPPLARPASLVVLAPRRPWAQLGLASYRGRLHRPPVAGPQSTRRLTLLTTEEGLRLGLCPHRVRSVARCSRRRRCDDAGLGGWFARRSLDICDVRWRGRGRRSWRLNRRRGTGTGVGHCRCKRRRDHVSFGRVRK